jgi:hypothetical protein
MLVDSLTITRKKTVLGTEIIKNPLCVEFVLDTSQCRSHSRAIRRHKAGIPGRVRTIERPAAYMIEGRMHMHPDMYDAMMRKIGRDLEKSVDKSLYQAFYQS